jgi:D-alanyl-D-alanine dipeptidase
MRCFIVLAVLVVAGNCVSAQSVIPLVDIKSVDPTIVIELRYAGANRANAGGRHQLIHG